MKVGIVLRTVIAVHGVTAFMGNGKQVAKHILLVVQQNIGFGSIRTAAEGSASLALVLIAVDPAFGGKSGFECFHVIRSKRLESFADGIHCLLVACVGLDSLDQGNIDIIVCQLLLAQQP
ncbi:hypothetical protein DSECCO2_611390 [anaerobic digester metagenome]